MKVELNKNYQFDIIIDNKVPKNQIWVEDSKGRNICKLKNIFSNSYKPHNPYLNSRSKEKSKRRGSLT